MNDRFKFKIWDKTNKIMHYNDFVVTSTGYIAPIIEDIDAEMTIDAADTEFEKDKILMQCTGKKDCNSKLIFEGDIVQLEAKNGMKFNYIVRFKNYQFILEYTNGKHKGQKARDFYRQYASPEKLYKHGYMVIGNIYENKELLDEIHN